MKHGLITTEEIPYNKQIKYGELCRIFGFNNTNGGYINRNLTKIRKEYLLNKVGRKYIIISKLETPKYAILDDRFCISYEDKNKSGVYKIQLNNEVYIGQTNNFLNRFNRHRRGNGGKEFTKILLENNAKFEALEKEDDRKQRLIKEAKYTKDYINMGYNVLNTIEVLYTNEKRHNGQIKYKEVRRTISLNDSNLNKVLELLKENNIEFRLHKLRGNNTKEDK